MNTDNFLGDASPGHSSNYKITEGLMRLGISKYSNKEPKP